VQRSTLRLLGDSKPMLQLRQMIAKVARSQAPVTSRVTRAPARNSWRG